jgi:hypothetical protein
MTATPPAGAFPVGNPPEPSVVTPNRAQFLADAIDPSTGEYRSISRGVDPVEAAALEALRIHYGSGSAVLNTGNKFREIEVVDDSIVDAIKSEVVFAWRRLIEDRKIELTSVTVETENDGASLVVRFKNLLSGNDNSRVSLPLLALMGQS